MLVKGQIEVFKNKKGYPTGIIKSFDKDGKTVLGKLFVAVSLRDEKMAEKLEDGKTYTISVEQGYLDVRHIELESESFEIPVISIVKGEVVKVFPEEKPVTKRKTTAKKSSK